MPNRILRDWTDSETMDSLDVNTERFFTRLIMKVDDFGRYSSNLKLIKSNLFPLKSDIRETDITRWLAECEKAGLIALYVVAQKGYLQIENFKQTLRQKKGKYPPPENCIADDEQLHSNCVADAPTKRNEYETETKPSETVPPALLGSNLYRQPVIPTKEQVWEVFKSNDGTKEMAKKFWETNEATGWFLKGSPIVNFQNLIPGYISSWKSIQPPQLDPKRLQV